MDVNCMKQMSGTLASIMIQQMITCVLCLMKVFHVFFVYLSCPDPPDVSDRIRVRHPAGHHGEGRAEQLAGQRHLRRKLQRRQLPAAAGGSGPEAGEEVRHRPRGRETAEHAGTGDATEATGVRSLYTMHGYQSLCIWER